MKIRFRELQGKMADDGKPSSQAAIAEMTGLDKKTLLNISIGNFTSIKAVYIDALCAISGMTPGQLIEVEPITLPLPPFRPDRKGARVGEFTKQKTTDQRVKAARAGKGGAG